MAAALRANATLTSLQFTDTQLWGDAAEVVLGALVGHRSLSELVVSFEHATEPATMGTALGALVSADAPALKTLMFHGNDLGDDGLAPIVDALPRNSHLLELSLRGNGMSEAFAAEQLLPAVRANTGLRTLVATSTDDHPASAVEAERLV